MSTKKDVFSLSKRNIRVAISSACNLSCIYCDYADGAKMNTPGSMEDFRSKPLKEGVIDTDTYIEIIRALCLTGFKGMTLTGGEPLLNSQWDHIVSEARKDGMERVGLTTNGMLLDSYIEKEGKLPDGLALLTLSLDTIDPKRFKDVTRKGNLEQVIRGVRRARESNPDLLIRANKVVLRSDMNSLVDYIRFCDESEVINEVNFLNLILKLPENKGFFQREFISAQEIMNFLLEKTNGTFFKDSKHEFILELPSGLKIILKDTNLTMRARQCDDCSIYCQEGFFTVRVATDGTIMLCPDYSAELPFIDGQLALQEGTLIDEVREMVKIFEEVQLSHTLVHFFQKKNIFNE